MASITQVNTGPMPGLSNPSFKRIEELAQKVNARWNMLQLWQKIALPVATAALLAFVVVAAPSMFGYLYGGSQTTITAAPLPMEEGSTKSPAVVAQEDSATATDVNFTSNPEVISRIQQGFSAFTDALETTKQAVVENRAMLNVHAKEIIAVKKDVDTIKHDPKVLKGFEDDMERLKQIMSKPFVPLVPVS